MIPVSDIPDVFAGIRQRLEAATPRPWHAYNEGIGWEIHEGDDHTPECVEINDEFRETFRRRDAEFIANAPTDIAALLAFIDAALALHHPCDCGGSSPHDWRKVPHCDDCGMPLPCPTVQALTGEAQQ